MRNKLIYDSPEIKAKSRLFDELKIKSILVHFLIDTKSISLHSVYIKREFSEKLKKIARILKMTNIVLLAEQDIKIENGQPVCSSLAVSERFGKRHDNLIRDIENLDCSEEFLALNFEEQSDKSGFIQKNRRFYNMTKDGFMFLVMGFTGKEAAKMKEKFINLFNEMEEKLRLQTKDNSNCNLAVPHHQKYTELLEKYVRLLETPSISPKNFTPTVAHRKKPQPLSKEQLREILELRNAGYTVREIAEKTDRTTKSVEYGLYVKARMVR